MARSPQRREDLIGEATAMPLRGEIIWQPEPEPCVIGFRATGAASVYFGEQPVLHFDARGRLRRLFAQDQQFVAQRGTLMQRKRVGPGYRLLADLHPLPPERQKQWLIELELRLRRLLQAVLSGQATWGRTSCPAPAITPPIELLLEQTEAGIIVGQL